MNKSMKDLSKFFSEGQKDTSRPHTINDDSGADDALYFELMSEYKMARRNDSEKAEEIRSRMKKLKNVSNRAKIGAAYL